MEQLLRRHLARGQSIGADSLWMRANDGISWGSWMPFSIDTVL